MRYITESLPRLTRPISLVFTALHRRPFTYYPHHDINFPSVIPAELIAGYRRPVHNNAVPFDAPVFFLRQNYERDDPVAVVLIQRDTGAVKHEFRTACEAAQPRYQAHLRAANAHGADIYITTNTLHPGARGRTKADIAEIRHIYLDVDGGGKKAVGAILQSDGMPTPHHVLETSPGKHQLLWQVEEFTKDEAERLVQSLAAKHNADQAVWDCARILRVPGFRNCKYSEPHFVRDVHENPATRVYTPADFPRYEVEREPVQRTHVQRVTGGSQSERDWAYAKRALEQGRPAEEIIREIVEYRKAHRPKPHVEQYARRTVLNAQRV